MGILASLDDKPIKKAYSNRRENCSGTDVLVKISMFEYSDDEKNLNDSSQYPTEKNS